MKLYLASRSMLIFFTFAGMSVWFGNMAGPEGITDLGATILALGTSSAAVIGARAALRAAERPAAKGR